jgi:hypothetical protein
VRLRLKWRDCGPKSGLDTIKRVKFGVSRARGSDCKPILAFADEIRDSDEPRYLGNPVQTHRLSTPEGPVREG